MSSNGKKALFMRSMDTDRPGMHIIQTLGRGAVRVHVLAYHNSDAATVTVDILLECTLLESFYAIEY